MTLRNDFEKSGSWLFRYRSFLPLLCLPLFAAALFRFSYLSTSHRVNEWWQAICLLISFSGLAVRVVTIGHAPAGTSGRNTKQQVAFTLSTTVIYSVVRHPLYFAASVLWIFTPTALGSFVAWPFFILLIPFYVLRLKNEEEVLRRELPGYPEYCLRTRYRLIPFVW